MKASIGIGLTTHNRHDVFKQAYKAITEHLPPGAKLVVVDDASDVPVPEATYRFDSNAGISRAKNKCLELLDDLGCDQFFLFDDDCWPVADNWWQPYIASPEPHLMYIFKDFATRPLGDTKLLYQDSRLKGYSHPRGCMLYLDHICLDTIGGFDTRHKRWGREHLQLSDRIFNSGLTTFRYADVVDSNKLLYSLDEHELAASTVPLQERRQYLAETKRLGQESKTASHYCEYRETTNPTKPLAKQNNIVLTAYFTNEVDAQRGEKWQADYSAIKTLIDSLQGQPLVILHDCFTKPDTATVKHVRVETTFTPYFQRWMEYYKYLRDHSEVDNLFIVDATDVEMLNNPFPHLEPGKLYVGDEPGTLRSPWLRKYNRENTVRNFLARHGSVQILNCGVVGGSREDVMRLCHDIFGMYFDTLGAVSPFEMGVFNYICRTKYAEKLVYGRQVTSIFKQYETEGEFWFIHK